MDQWYREGGDQDAKTQPPAVASQAHIEVSAIGMLKPSSRIRLPARDIQKLCKAPCKPCQKACTHSGCTPHNPQVSPLHMQYALDVGLTRSLLSFYCMLVIMACPDAKVASRQFEDLPHLKPT